MNYRHAFHAGNFADLIKHAAVTLIMERLTADGGPLLVLDSHAGAGTYDLGGAFARKAGEAQGGALRLMADPAAPGVFEPLKADIRQLNPDGMVRVYPGSPWLIASRLRRQDHYLGAELRPDDALALTEGLGPWSSRAEALQTDGFGLIAAHAADRQRLFVLIDPPYEQADDYDRIVQAIAALRVRPQPTVTLIWAPLKDLETFDGFVRAIEALEPGPALAVETRLAPLTDPMRMNGCALVIVAPPPGIEAALQDAARWVARARPDGLAKLWTLNS